MRSPAADARARSDRSVTALTAGFGPRARAADLAASLRGIAYDRPTVKPFTIRIDEEPGRAIVRLEGELDIATTPRAETDLRRLEDEGVGVIVLDLRGLTFMDSTGLRLLVAADARAREAERRLAIVRGPGPVHRVLEITGLHTRLDIVGDPGEVAAA